MPFRNRRRARIRKPVVIQRSKSNDRELADVLRLLQELKKTHNSAQRDIPIVVLALAYMLLTTVSQSKNFDTISTLILVVPILIVVALSAIRRNAEIKEVEKISNFYLSPWDQLESLSSKWRQTFESRTMFPKVEGLRSIAGLTESFCSGIGSVLEIFPPPERFDAWRLTEEVSLDDGPPEPNSLIVAGTYTAILASPLAGGFIGGGGVIGLVSVFVLGRRQTNLPSPSPRPKPAVTRPVAPKPATPKP